MSHEPLLLMLFETRAEHVVAALAAGVQGMIVDCEWRGKERRQAGSDTEINREAPSDLGILQRLEVPTRWCRLNAFGPWTPAEVEEAVANGATMLLLPMVRSVQQVESFLEIVGGRCRSGILVETRAAVDQSAELARLPLDAVYVGLNDLAIDSGAPSLFEALVNGTVERVRAAFAETPFGFGGATVIDAGFPIPCRLLLAEMARLSCSFTFLRRSFKRDIRDRDLRLEIARVQETWSRLGRRSAVEIEADRERLARAVRDLA